MKKVMILALTLILYHSSTSQECTIFGNAGTYSGDKIKVYKYTDYFTKLKKLVAEFPVDSIGSFSFKIKAEEPFQAYFDLDVFVGKLIIEPGKELKIVLPQKTVRNQEDVLNPYFSPMEFYIRILNDDLAINSGIRMLTTMYDESVKEIFKDPKYINSGLVEKEIQKMEEKTVEFTQDFFIKYKEYKFLHLRQQSYYKNKQAVLRKNFSEKPILYENPAYNQLLEEEFGKFFFEANADSLFHILDASKDWKALTRYLSKNELYYKKDFRELMIVLNFSKLFYVEQAYQKSILRIFQTALNSDINEHTKKSILNFIQKSGNLMQGSFVQNFTLYDQNKQQISLKDFRGNFVYLCFLSKDSYACQKDIILLDELSKKKSDLLTVLAVYTDHSHQNIIDLTKKNKYEWPILHCYEGDRVLEDYNVVAYPTYYLIHPEGTLSLMPAPGPSEDFDAAFFNAYQEYKRKLIRESDK